VFVSLWIHCPPWRVAVVSRCVPNGIMAVDERNRGVIDHAVSHLMFELFFILDYPARLLLLVLSILSFI
jgi:hypothetical protein